LSAVDSLREKIAQMFIVGCRGERAGDDERLLFEEYAFGGFILFRDNCCEPRRISSLCRQLWDTTLHTPPFLAIDQEGGRVHRLPSPFTHFPAAAEIGARRDRDLAYRCGRAAATELALVGINLNFAPVLDVNSNPLNPIIGDRSFGAEPEQVIDLSSAWLGGLRDGGIIPCGKHFPGHGATEQDSHLALPVVAKSLDELKAIELPPFSHACRNGIDALMTAHVRYTALDSNVPATLSERIVTGLLRHQLGYDGVVFSDDLDMKAISDNFTPQEAAARAVLAGVDVLLFCHDLPKAVKACEFLYAEAEKEPALRARIEKSYRRIVELKRRYLKSFIALADDEIVAQLKAMNHQRIVDEVYGSL
jgi:beta-N-acetylhexosaminidase